MDEKTIDRKFDFVAFNPINQKVYTQQNALILCAKDAAVPAALEAYKQQCIDLDADDGHIKSIELLQERVRIFQANMPDGKGRVPDTEGDELARCLDGVDVRK